MNVKEALYNIRFTTGTIDDTSGKAVNQLFTNKQIVTQLNLELLQYANITKAIQDVFSFPLDTNTPFVKAPSLALRSEPYIFAGIYQNGIFFPIDVRNVRESMNTYRYRPIQGITNWLAPWGAGKDQFFSVFPTNSLAPITATLNADISKTETTIPIVLGPTSLILQEGRVTIGTEKILYQRRDSNYLYGCERGVEETEAQTHITGATITQNNVILYYCRRPLPIEVNDEDWVTNEQLVHEIEVCEEHMQGILKATSYNLLLKVSPQRAESLKQDYEELYNQYATDIRKGYYKFKSRGIRPPYQIAETGVPYGTNLMY